MRVERLVLEDFRNYERADVTFDPHINVVVGRNAQGKTNLLEAVHCLSGLGSPRSVDADLVRAGEDSGLLHADLLRGERRLHLDLEFRPGRATRVLLNGSAMRGTKALRELTVSVFFGPDELGLVKGPPDGRRRFLDELVVKLRPTREELRREWDRVLKQRNALLKSQPWERHRGRPSDALDVWDAALCRAGAQLTAARLEALGALKPYAGKRYGEIAGAGELEVGYASAWLEPQQQAEATAQPDGIDVDALQTALSAKLDDVRERELERRISLAGPHRDDLSIRLTSASPFGAPLLDARNFASQGDQRTAALALKLGEHDLLTEALGEQPILLLDDVFSELDRDRRAWLAETVRRSGQTVLSSAEPLSEEVVGRARVIEVRAGNAVVTTDD